MSKSYTLGQLFYVSFEDRKRSQLSLRLNTSCKIRLNLNSITPWVPHSRVTGNILLYNCGTMRERRESGRESHPFISTARPFVIQTIASCEISVTHSVICRAALFATSCAAETVKFSVAFMRSWRKQHAFKSPSEITAAGDNRARSTSAPTCCNMTSLVEHTSSRPRTRRSMNLMNHLKCLPQRLRCTGRSAPWRELCSVMNCFIDSYESISFLVDASRKVSFLMKL